MSLSYATPGQSAACCSQKCREPVIRNASPCMELLEGRLPVRTIPVCLGRLRVAAILRFRHDRCCVKRPANARLLLVPGILLCAAPLHQLGQEGQHLLRIPQCVAGLGWLDLQSLYTSACLKRTGRHRHSPPLPANCGALQERLPYEVKSPSGAARMPAFWPC